MASPRSLTSIPYDAASQFNRYFESDKVDCKYNPNSNDSPKPEFQQQVSTPLYAPLHHQRQVQQGDVAEDMVIVLLEEAALKKSMTVQQQAKEARPAKKFVEEGSIAFCAKLQRFQAVINIPGLSTKLKVIELSHWFIAGKLVASYSIYDAKYLQQCHSGTQIPVWRKHCVIGTNCQRAQSRKASGQEQP